MERKGIPFGWKHRFAYPVRGGLTVSPFAIGRVPTRKEGERMVLEALSQMKRVSAPAAGEMCQVLEKYLAFLVRQGILSGQEMEIHRKKAQQILKTKKRRNA